MIENPAQQSRSERRAMVEFEEEECPTVAANDDGASRLDWSRPVPIVHPEPTSVYRYYDENGLLLYVGITSRGSVRQREHNGDKEWWRFVHRRLAGDVGSHSGPRRAAHLPLHVSLDRVNAAQHHPQAPGHQKPVQHLHLRSGRGMKPTTDGVNAPPETDVYVVETPRGFTESFDRHTIDVLERLGLIRHVRDGHVLEDGSGRGVGPLHRFYVGGA